MFLSMILNNTTAFSRTDLIYMNKHDFIPNTPMKMLGQKVGTFISPVLRKSESVVSMNVHLENRDKAGKTKTRVRRKKTVTEKRNGIIMMEGTNNKTLLRMGRDFQMVVICRRRSGISRDTFEKMDFNRRYTFMSLECINYSSKD